jgi:ubiquinone/menaquinone biosynthesis C-methylase UbiE
VESLPFTDDFFDKVLCVHVLYFWKDLDVSLREIARVLKSSGRVGLLPDQGRSSGLRVISAPPGRRSPRSKPRAV